MFKLKPLENLIHEIGRLPGIGPKSAARLAQYLIKEPGLSESLRESLQDVQQNVSFCPSCFSYAEIHNLCSFCSSQQRLTNMICVVEDPEDIIPIENSGSFNGLYHVLHGTISPLDGRGPEDIKISALLKKIAATQQASPDLKIELIFALDSDIEGDTTILYLLDQLKTWNIKSTRLAQGVPIGSDINYIDNRTLGSALVNRVEL
jgi:recombination protein RecR